jgi:hypothetical protein
VLEYAHTGLQEHLSLKTEGYKCSTEDLLSIPPGVAVSCNTIESICSDLVDMPDADTVRQCLNEPLMVEEWPELECCVNAVLAVEIPSRVWRRARHIAIDFHDRPYHSKALQEEGLRVRGGDKDGTTRFYCVATAYVILNRLHITLAIHFVLPGADTVTVVDILLRRVRDLGIRTHVRSWTTSPNLAYRFLLIELSFFLLNIWLHLR